MHVIRSDVRCRCEHLRTVLAHGASPSDMLFDSLLEVCSLHAHVLASACILHFGRPQGHLATTQGTDDTCQVRIGIVDRRKQRICGFYIQTPGKRHLHRVSNSSHRECGFRRASMFKRPAMTQPSGSYIPPFGDFETIAETRRSRWRCWAYNQLHKSARRLPHSPGCVGAPGGPTAQRLIATHVRICACAYPPHLVPDQPSHVSKARKCRSDHFSPDPRPGSPRDGESRWPSGRCCMGDGAGSLMCYAGGRRRQPELLTSRCASRSPFFNPYFFMVWHRAGCCARARALPEGSKVEWLRSPSTHEVGASPAVSRMGWRGWRPWVCCALIPQSASPAPR